MNSSRYSGPRAWALLVALFIAYNLSLLDRMIIGLLVEPIKADLEISDTQISLLQGFAFLLMYSIVGLPIGRLVDKVSRTKLIGFGIVLWSAMTAVCGLAKSFSMLFVGRVGVGIGEATLSPAAYSLISNIFSKSRLAFALGVYSLGGVTGAGLAFVIGGYVFAWLNSIAPISLPVLGNVEPWQAAFLLLGCPGIVIACVVWLFPEPSRPAREASTDRAASGREVMAFYRMNARPLLFHHLGVGLCNMVLFGSYLWLAPFLMRVHGWQVERIGAVVGALHIVAGAVGLLGGGYLSDALARHGWTNRLSLCIAVLPLGAVVAVGYALSDDAVISVVLMTVFFALAILPFNVGNAGLQLILPENMRGLASAIFLFFVSMLNSVGPLAVALLSDFIFSEPHGIRFSLAIFGAGGLLLAALCFALAKAPYGQLVAQRGMAVSLEEGRRRPLRENLAC